MSFYGNYAFNNDYLYPLGAISINKIILIECHRTQNVSVQYMTNVFLKMFDLYLDLV